MNIHISDIPENTAEKLLAGKLGSITLQFDRDGLHPKTLHLKETAYGIDFVLFDGGFSIIDYDTLTDAEIPGRSIKRAVIHLADYYSLNTECFYVEDRRVEKYLSFSA